MGAHAIIISKVAQKASGTSIPMAVVAHMSEHLPDRNDAYILSDTLMKHIIEHCPKEWEFIASVGNDVIFVSDAHGQLSEYEVRFSDVDPRGYYFDVGGF